MQIGSHEVIIERKRTKHLYLRIKNATQVHISAPCHWPREEIVKIVEARSDWIIQQQQKLARKPEHATVELTDGAQVPYQASDYRLVLQKGRRSVTLDAQQIIVRLPGPGDEAAVSRVLDDWYRQQLKKRIAELLDYWQPVMQVNVNDFGVRKMRTRWGSCNIHRKKIWLNFDLIKKSRESLEYVVVHELTHLYERYHNARFYALMDKYLPDWSARRHRLNHIE